MQQDTAEELHPVVRKLAADIIARGARQVILYGSRARADHAPRSDYDLAADAPGLTEKQKREIEELVENAETLYKIDLVWLQDVPEELRKNILRDCRVIDESTD